MDRFAAEASPQRRLKLEGIELMGIAPSGAIELIVVADMDDPDLPSVIASLTWGPR